MNRQFKLDLIAGGAILVMFLGAFILSLSSLGFILITAGGIVMLVLFLMLLRKDQ